MSEDDLIMVDFDGTLTKGEAKWWEDEIEEPREDVLEWVRQQYYSGAHVVVWTARPWSEGSTIAARLTEWEVPYHGIRCEKGASDLYVDDKAVTISDTVDQLAERIEGGVVEIEEGRTASKEDIEETLKND
jgi:phosphoserine phosphatase